MKLPAIQFYPGDWHKDQGIQSLDLMQRGAWFELLLMMHDSDERGVLLVNGIPMPDAVIARRLGLDMESTSQILAALLQFGVASRRKDDNAFYSRRMVRDERLRQTRTEAGMKGGNPSLVKQKSTTGVNQIPTPSSTLTVTVTEEQDTLRGVGEFGRVATAPLTPSPAITLEGKEVEACKSISELEATWHRYPTRHAETGFKNLVNAKKKELLAEAAKDVAKPKNIAKHITDLVPDPELNFDAFWKAYGHTKGNKEKANRAWVLLPVDVRRHIIRGLPQFIGSLRDRQYQPHATTFFSGKLWANESYTVPDSPIALLKVAHRTVGGVAPTETYLPDYQQKFRDQSAKQYR